MTQSPAPQTRAPAALAGNTARSSQRWHGLSVLELAPIPTPDFNPFIYLLSTIVCPRVPRTIDRATDARARRALASNTARARARITAMAWHQPS